jgi:2-methylcitrate dehydratase
LPYCTAVALVDGKITADQFSEERLADPALLDLVARTTVVEDAELTAGYPAGIPNRVKVTLVDGSVRMLEMAFPPGHDKNPLTDDQLHEKFRGLAEPVLGADRVTACLEQISEIQTLQRPHELIRLLDLPE